MSLKFQMMANKNYTLTTVHQWHGEHFGAAAAVHNPESNDNKRDQVNNKFKDLETWAVNSISQL